MDLYCSIYSNINEFLFNDDKTLLINFIQLLSRTSLLLALLLLILGTEHLLVLSLWVALLLTSPFRRGLKAHFQPVITFLLGESSKMMAIATKGLVSLTTALAISRNLEQMDESIEFYFYHYERWWLFEGWKDETKKYSDEDYDCFLSLREESPAGYAWIEDWRIDFNCTVDS